MLDTVDWIAATKLDLLELGEIMSIYPLSQPPPPNSLGTVIYFEKQ